MSRWNRNMPYNNYGNSMGGNVGFYMGSPPVDRRPYNAQPMGKPYYQPYREDYSRQTDRRDDFRGGKRGPPLPAKSPDHRNDNSAPRRDNRAPKRQQNQRYDVKIPHISFDTKTLTASSLRRAYPKISITGDFYECESKWVDAFPLYEPFEFGSASDFYVLHREIDSPVTPEFSEMHPADADYSYSVRVMLLAHHETAELYKMTCRMAGEDGHDKQPPAKQLSFLLAGKSKNETAAIGGPWSPSLDGSDPQSNPQTLINTAIRTFKGFTGVDLSTCSEWIRFMEIKYYRFPGTKVPSYAEDEEERVVDSETPEVVVFMIPRFSHLMPNDEDWNKVKEQFATSLSALIEEPAKAEETAVETATTESTDAPVDASMGEADESLVQGDAEPTHYSKLDMDTLKVNELRTELAARKLDTKGLKVNLVSRLQTALDAERKVEEKGDDKTESEATADQPAKSVPTSPPKEEKKELTEIDRRRLKRLYRVPDRPTVLIHPNKTIKGGRFDCHRVLLHSLLDYRNEDQKETHFEVSLFAEQFNQMLQRDCAFTIFKAVHDAPEKDNKTETDGKCENGTSEPDAKRIRASDTASSDAPKTRAARRTVNPKLLFAFTYFDTGHSGFLRNLDLCDILHLLDMRFSRTQMRKIVAKVLTRRDMLYYDKLTDADVPEGSDKDVTVIHTPVEDDKAVMRMLALGNLALFDTEKPVVPGRIVVGGGDGGKMLARIEVAEKLKRNMEFQFHQIKDELEKTRTSLNGYKDVEERMQTENSDLSTRLKTEQTAARENRSLVGVYGHLLRGARDQMERSLRDITAQFDKEKAKREAEKAAVAAAAAKEKEAAEKTEATEEAEEKVTEEQKDANDFQVVDSV